MAIGARDLDAILGLGTFKIKPLYSEVRSPSGIRCSAIAEQPQPPFHGLGCPAMNLQALSTFQSMPPALVQASVGVGRVNRKAKFFPRRVEELFAASNIVLFHRQFPPSPRQPDEEISVEHSHGNSSRSFRGPAAPSISVTTDNLVDFCQEQALRRPVKQVQKTTGLSKKQVENIRQGLSAVSGKTLTNWIKNDPDFAGDFAEFSGIVRPGEARWASMITRLANEVARQDANKET